MAAFCGSEGLSKSGIHKPTDLIIFPWEKEPTAPLSDVEVAEMQAEMAALNALNKAKP
jgi:hypothetical protein